MFNKAGLGRYVRYTPSSTTVVAKQQKRQRTGYRHQDEFDYDRIRGSRTLLALFYCLYPAKHINQHMLEVCRKNDRLLRGHRWLGDWPEKKLFRVFYDDDALTETTLTPCLYLETPMAISSDSNTPTTSRKRASSLTGNSKTKRIRTENARTARIASLTTDTCSSMQVLRPRPTLVDPRELARKPHAVRQDCT